MLQVHGKKIAGIRAGMIEGPCGAMTPLFLTFEDGQQMVQYLQGPSASFSRSELPWLVEQIEALGLPMNEEEFFQRLSRIEPTGQSTIGFARGQVRGDTYVAAFPTRDGRPFSDTPVYSIVQAIEFARVWLEKNEMSLTEVVVFLKDLKRQGVTMRAPESLLREMNINQAVEHTQRIIGTIVGRPFSDEDLALIAQISVRMGGFRSAFPEREYEKFPGLR